MGTRIHTPLHLRPILLVCLSHIPPVISKRESRARTRQARNPGTRTILPLRLALSLQSCLPTSICSETSFTTCKLICFASSFFLTALTTVLSFTVLMDWRTCYTSFAKLNSLLTTFVSASIVTCSMAASFYSSPLIGATTTLACFAHEIPHEIADYSILVRSGFTKRQAMQSQFLTAVGAFVSPLFGISSPSLTASCWFCFAPSNFHFLTTRNSDFSLHDGNLTLLRVKRSGESLPLCLSVR